MKASGPLHANFVFHEAYEYYCFKNCYSQLLQCYGVEHPVFFLDCGVDWLFREEDGKHGYNFSTGDAFSSFLPSYLGHAHFYDDRLGGAAEIWEHNQRKLKEEVPLVVAADVYELDYTPYYRKKHSFHSLLLCGYKEDTQEFDLVDWYTPWFFKGSLTKAALDAARSSRNPADGILSGNPIRYLWVEVDQEGWEAPVRHLIEEALSLCLSQFYCQPRGRDLEQGGVYALHALLRRLEQEKDAGSDRAGFLEDLHGKLFFTASRKKFLKFYLCAAAEEWSSSKLKSCIRQLDETIQEWKKLSSVVIKASISQKNAHFEQAASLLRGLILKEKRFYYELYTASKSLHAEGYPVWI